MWFDDYKKITDINNMVVEYITIHLQKGIISSKNAAFCNILPNIRKSYE
jgi:hypothetical protein